jgi:uncharacterized protein YggT (Ycf19 family)
MGNDAQQQQPELASLRNIVRDATGYDVRPLWALLVLRALRHARG